MIQTHQFEPVFYKNSKVLILGTFPSPKSRQIGFYYSHPQNRFWPVMADLFHAEVPQSTVQKKQFLLHHDIALWDVLHSCEINGAEDASIRRPEPNDIGWLLRQSSIRAIFTTGKKAQQLYMKYCYPQTGKEAISLPSTSPANCRFNYEELKKAYSAVLEYL